jgi:succinyl-CoA synthetase beta subunit
MRSEQVRAIFVNIFGGIMRCDLIAEGIIAASTELALKLPLVVRLEGAKVAQGRQLLGSSGLRIQSGASMAECAQLAVQAAKAQQR